MNFDLAELEKAVFMNGGKYGQQRNYPVQNS